jgi:ribosomal protein S27AE
MKVAESHSMRPTATQARKCPRCGSDSEVLATLGDFRERQCLNPDCRQKFETRELLVPTREFRIYRADVRRAAQMRKAA